MRFISYYSSSRASHLLFIIVLTGQPLYAHNCSELSDCYNYIAAAVLVALLLGGGIYLFMIRGVLARAAQSFAATVVETAIWEYFQVWSTAGAAGVVKELTGLASTAAGRAQLAAMSAVLEKMVPRNAEEQRYLTGLAYAINAVLDNWK
jgi:hypothetical protein